MSVRALWAIMAGLLLAGASTANAANRVALVIGNSSYTSVPTLPNPRNDAEDIAVALRNLGFDVVEGRDLDRRGMADAVRRFSRNLPGSDIALFFYAGHGVQIGGNNYLLPTDVKVETTSDVKLDTIDVGTIMEEMGAEKRVNLIFLDACRDNPFANSLLSGGRSISSRGLAQQDSSVGSLIAFATQPNNIALDGSGRNSPFTQALLKHLKTPGLEIRAMLSRVRNDVIAATGGKQVPWENSSLTGEIVLVPTPSSPPSSLAAEVKSENYKNESDTDLSFWQSAERIGTKAAFEAYKREFGSEGRFAALADERIAALSTSNLSNVSSRPTDLPKAQNTADEKSRAKDQRGVRPVRNPKSQTVKNTPDEQSSPRSVRPAVRVAPPTRKKEVRTVSRAAQSESQAQMQYRPAPQPEPQVQVQYHAPVLTAPFGHHRPRLGIGIGLGGLGIGF
ncbi:caspase family protein [Microvirga massiliensis]|uniref:caspase family protein n=1 Tax=Microvirga massiliensis TaxID=1033741 RepID=UPI0006610656|nr:caspase domain-containing protein [Microvirga massiliensis]